VQALKPDPARLISPETLQQFGLQVSWRSSALHDKFKSGLYVNVPERLQDAAQFIQSQVLSCNLDSVGSGLVALMRRGRKGMLLSDEHAASLVLFFSTSLLRDEAAHRMVDTELDPSAPESLG
jgi:hypothetical protein